MMALPHLCAQSSHWKNAVKEKRQARWHCLLTHALQENRRQEGSACTGTLLLVMHHAPPKTRFHAGRKLASFCCRPMKKNLLPACAAKPSPHTRQLNSEPQSRSE